MKGVEGIVSQYRTGTRFVWTFDVDGFREFNAAEPTCTEWQGSVELSEPATLQEVLATIVAEMIPHSCEVQKPMAMGVMVKIELPGQASGES